MGVEQSKVKSHWAYVDDVRWHARTSADTVPRGPTLVLVHGIGITSRYWTPTINITGREFKTYAPDLPGFGLTDKPERTQTLAELTDWLAKWIRVLDLQNCVLIGNSFGCQIVADFAVRYAAIAKRVVLIGPTTDPQGQTAFEQIRRWMRNNPGEPFQHKVVSYRDYADCGLRRIIKTFAFSLRDHIEANLPYIQAPTVVVRGSNDPIVPQRWAEEATRLLPCGRLIVIPGAFHTVNFSSPLELTRVLRPFLREFRKEIDSKRA